MLRCAEHSTGPILALCVCYVLCIKNVTRVFSEGVHWYTPPYMSRADTDGDTQKSVCDTNEPCHLHFLHTQCVFVCGTVCRATIACDHTSFFISIDPAVLSHAQPCFLNERPECAKLIMPFSPETWCANWIFHSFFFSVFSSRWWCEKQQFFFCFVRSCSPVKFQLMHLPTGSPSMVNAYYWGRIRVICMLHAHTDARVYALGKS